MNLLRKAKRHYYARLFMEVGNDSKRIWLSLNSIMGNKENRSLKEVKVNNITLIGRDLADYANNYFVNAADAVTSGIQFPDIFTCYAPRTNSTCFFFPTDYREVLSVILSLKNKGSKLLDIHPVIIKENKEIVADHSEQLYNLSLTGIMFPNALKIARVIPVHKSGPVDIMDNFRPISVLPVFSKIFEKLTYKRMENFAVTHNILSACQFGFRRGRSTTLAIAKLISHVVKAFHQKMYCNINDLPMAVKETTVLFADDAAFVLCSPTLEGFYQKIRQLFLDIASYLNINMLVPNSSKSKLMMFASRPIPVLPDLIFAGNIIEWVKEFKYLGFTITDNLSFAKHIGNVSLNISRIPGILKNLRLIVPLSILIKVYFGLAHPHLTSHLIIWGAAPPSHMKALKIRINNMLRIILGVAWMHGRPLATTRELYKRLGLLNSDSLFKYNLYKFYA